MGDGGLPGPGSGTQSLSELERPPETRHCSQTPAPQPTSHLCLQEVKICGFDRGGQNEMVFLSHNFPHQHVLKQDFEGHPLRFS